jgi:hypothetical protein
MRRWIIAATQAAPRLHHLGDLMVGVALSWPWPEGLSVTATANAVDFSPNPGASQRSWRGRSSADCRADGSNVGSQDLAEPL